MKSRLVGFSLVLVPIVLGAQTTPGLRDPAYSDIGRTFQVRQPDAGLDPATLLKPLGESWPTYSGDYTGRRYSSLTQINQSTIKNVALAWLSRGFVQGSGA